MSIEWDENTTLADLIGCMFVSRQQLSKKQKQIYTREFSENRIIHGQPVCSTLMVTVNSGSRFNFSRARLNDIEALVHEALALEPENNNLQFNLAALRAMKLELNC